MGEGGLRAAHGGGRRWVLGTLVFNTSWGQRAEMEFGVMNPDKNERGGGYRGAHRLSGELMNISSLGAGRS